MATRFRLDERSLRLPTGPRPRGRRPGRRGRGRRARPLPRRRSDRGAPRPRGAHLRQRPRRRRSTSSGWALLPDEDRRRRPADRPGRRPPSGPSGSGCSPSAPCCSSDEPGWCSRPGWCGRWRCRRSASGSCGRAPTRRTAPAACSGGRPAAACCSSSGSACCSRRAACCRPSAGSGWRARHRRRRRAAARAVDRAPVARPRRRAARAHPLRGALGDRRPPARLGAADARAHPAGRGARAGPARWPAARSASCAPGCSTSGRPTATATVATLSAALERVVTDVEDRHDIEVDLVARRRRATMDASPRGAGGRRARGGPQRRPPRRACRR